MKLTNPVRSVACAALLCIAYAAPVVSLAQTDSKPASRAEVKEQTRAANKAGQLTSGEATPGEKQAPINSTKTRAERKAETMEARRKGELRPSGEATYKSSMSQQGATAKSTKTRAERKAETLEAAKQGKLPPGGELGDTKK
jgi:hypothetical protein